MELRYLKYFLAVADEMNFNRAAKRLHISQPPLSRQVQALERELGTRLLERDGKRFQLTEAGRHFKDGAARILDEVGALERQTRFIGGSSSTLMRLGFVGSMMFSILPELLAHLENRMPEVRFDVIELATEQQVEAILSGKIDLGFLRSWVEIDGIAFDPLGEESLFIVYPVSMDASPAGRSDLAAFAEEPFVSTSGGAAPGLSERIADMCAGAGFRPNVRYACSQLSSVLRLVAAGLGWSIVPAFSVWKMTIENVRILPLPEKVLFGVAYRNGTIPERVRAVVAQSKKFLCESLADRA